MDEIFDSCLRSSGDLAGVLESDEETVYFYLFDNGRLENNKIVASARLPSQLKNEEMDSLTIRWSDDETLVGLFLRGGLISAFGIEPLTVYDEKNGAELGVRFTLDTEIRLD